MALLNALKTGTYSTVRISRYNKHGVDKEIRFWVDIWEDNTKSKLLVSIEKTLGQVDVDFTIPDRGQNKAPSSPSYGDTIVVGDAPTGDIANFPPRHILEWVENGSFDINGDPVDGWVAIDNLVDDMPIYVTSEDKYYKVRDGSWIELKGFIGSTEWGQWFDSGNWSASGSNMLTSIYEYLKTTAEFDHCIDA